MGQHALGCRFSTQCESHTIFCCNDNDIRFSTGGALHITREGYEDYHVDVVDIGFGKTHEAVTLIAWHTMCMPMKRIGSHHGNMDHIFESQVKLAYGVIMMDSVVTPDSSGHFFIGIVNTPVCDIKLRQ